MRKATKEELEEFKKVDRKIFDIVKNLNEENFKDLWIDKMEYERHLKKRITEKAVKDKSDYVEKIKECVLMPEEVFIKKYDLKYKEKFKRWDRIYYKKNNNWLSIFNEKSKINTSYFINKDFNEILFKGKMKTFKILNITTKELENARKN